MKGIVIQRYADLYKTSKGTIYRELRKKYGKQKTLNRKKVIDQALIDAVGHLKIKGEKLGAITTNKRNPRELPTDIAIQMLIENYGVEDARILKSSTVNRRLRESGFRDRDIKVRVEASYANQEHQIDFSRSKYFQIVGFDTERNDWILKVSGRELHYKKDDRRTRLWLCQLKDSYSGIRLARGYGATGESALMGLEFLNYCYNRKEDDHPLNYIPDMLKSDNGAFEKKKEVKAVLEALQIEARRSKPYNKDSQGKIESGWATAWRRFELPLSIKLGAGTRLLLAEYNQLLHQFSIKDMAKEHTRYDKYTKEKYYRIGIMEHPPREISDEIIHHAFRVEYRTVRQDLMVTIDKVPYECPAFAEGKRIRVYKSMSGEFRGELIDEDRKQFGLIPYRFRKIDDFEHRHPATYRQKLEVEVERIEKERIETKDRSEDWQQYKQAIIPSIHQEAESPFHRQDAKDAEIIFNSDREARLYIGKHLPKGKTFMDFKYYFEPILAKAKIEKKSIDYILEQLPAFERSNVGQL